MGVSRLEHIPGFNIDRVAAAAGDDPDVLRMENLDTDIPPPAEAMEATRAAVGEDEANSWLPACGTWHDPSLVRRMNPSLFACHEAGAERDAPAAGYPQSQALLMAVRPEVDVAAAVAVRVPLSALRSI